MKIEKDRELKRVGNSRDVTGPREGRECRHEESGELNGVGKRGEWRT